VSAAATGSPGLRRALLWLCGGIAGSALLAIMGLTFVDVLGRKLLDTSLPGALELTELLMVAVIFAALPLVGLQGEHVVFDSLDRWLPARVRRAQQALVDLLCMLLLAGLAWLVWAKAGQMAEFGDTTAQLKLPLAPFVHALAVALGVAAAVQALLLVQPVAHHHAGVDDAPPGGGAA
jgi:TRAP-type C4-dicarboxylate transport system permease small subunit